MSWPEGRALSRKCQNVKRTGSGGTRSSSTNLQMCPKIEPVEKLADTSLRWTPRASMPKKSSNLETPSAGRQASGFWRQSAKHAKFPPSRDEPCAAVGTQPDFAKKPV